MNDGIPDLSLVNSGAYAEDVLNIFDRRIALERPDAMLFMTVGGGRLRLLRNLTKNMVNHLRPGERAPKPGLCFEGVLGAYGSGKSHLALMLKHNAFTCGSEVLVAHVAITNEGKFSSVLAAILRSVRMAGEPSRRAQDVEVSAYRMMWEWAGHSHADLLQVAREGIGNLPMTAAADFVDAVEACAADTPDSTLMQRFIDAWVDNVGGKEAKYAFEMVLRVFNRLRSKRFLIIIDEFEAFQAFSEEDQRQVLQGFQDLCDDLMGREPGLPSTHLVCFSTGEWWERAAGILPSLLGKMQRVRAIHSIPGINQMDVAGLMYRYLGLFQLSGDAARETTTEEFNSACNKLWQELGGHQNDMRTIHAAVRDTVETLLL